MIILTTHRQQVNKKRTTWIKIQLPAQLCSPNNNGTDHLWWSSSQTVRFRAGNDRHQHLVDIAADI